MEDGLNRDMGIESSELASTGQDRQDSDGHLNNREATYLRAR